MRFLPKTPLLLSFCYAVLLLCCVSSGSLWTDEAFSAYLGSHRTVYSLVDTMRHGDSSDLQMPLYYFYLFSWGKIFGLSEFSARAANVPFFLIFSLSLVFASWRVFGTKIGWVVVGCLPFILHYAGEARAYMAVLAFSAAALTCLARFVYTDSRREKEALPWICLATIFIGCCFHMLFLLAVPLLLTFALVSTRYSDNPGRWRKWIKPAFTFLAPFVLLTVYFGYTFLRGTSYVYAKPGIRQMASVAYELAGFSGLGPNRKLTLDFAPYFGTLAIGAVLFLTGIACAAAAYMRTSSHRYLVPLLAACSLALLEVGVLTLMMDKQLDARHCAALLPVFLFLYLALSGTGDKEGNGAAFARVSQAFLLMVWLLSDFRLLRLPEYQREDYRGAVDAAVRFQQSTKGQIAFFGDPLAGAYYGLELVGDAPCFPLSEGCRSGLERVAWPRKTEAQYAARWSSVQTQQWISQQRREGKPVALVIQLDRWNRYLGWWPLLSEQPADAKYRIHGFRVVTIN